MNHDLQPVLIGAAQQVWRDRNSSRTPVDALEEVICMALSDTGSARVIGEVDRLVHVPFIMNQVPHFLAAMPNNPGAAVAERLGIKAAQYSADVGGNLPQQMINHFARQLQAGEGEVVLLCGVELLASFLGAVRAGQPFPDWATGVDAAPQMLASTPPMSAPTELSHGLFEPVNAYPLFESALRHRRGIDAEAHQALLGEMIATMSNVAVDNPYAWKQQRLTAAEVVATANGNRMISYPYTKVMNAFIGVDQAAAVVLTTAGKARAMGVDPGKMIYLRGGAEAHDSWYLSERPRLDDSPALRAAGAAALAQAQLSLDELDFFDLYSCFPAAVQVAADALGLALDDPRGLTITGGMMLFGGPGNNYSLHGIAELVARLRGRGRASGLVSANGGYLTKHAVGVYSTEPADESAPERLPDSAELQAKLDRAPGYTLREQASGDAEILAHTVRYSGIEPMQALFVAALSERERCVGVSDDATLLQRLVREDCVGQKARIEHRDGMNHVQF